MAAHDPERTSAYIPMVNHAVSGGHKRGKCGDISRKGGIILCEIHRNNAEIEILLPFSWQGCTR